VPGKPPFKKHPIPKQLLLKEGKFRAGILLFVLPPRLRPQVTCQQFMFFKAFSHPSFNQHPIPKQKPLKEGKFRAGMICVLFCLFYHPGFVHNLSAKN